MSRQVDWGNRRPRRRAGSVALVVAVLLVLSIGVWGAWLLTSRESAASRPGGAAQLPPCPTVAPSPAAPAPSKIHVELLNGTSTSGLARRTGDALAARGFVVDAVGNAEKPYPAVAQIRYGPGAQAAAGVLAAQFSAHELVAQPTLSGHLVVVVGAQFTGLAPAAAPAATPSASAHASPSPTCR